jgi:hypothetical protein
MTYCELTIERLALAHDVWDTERRGLTPEDEAELWPMFGTTAEAYFAFAGSHRSEIDAYLAGNPAAREEIDFLRSRIDEIIEQMEVQ